MPAAGRAARARARRGGAPAARALLGLRGPGLLPGGQPVAAGAPARAARHRTQGAFLARAAAPRRRPAMRPRAQQAARAAPNRSAGPAQLVCDAAMGWHCEAGREWEAESAAVPAAGLAGTANLQYCITILYYNIVLQYCITILYYRG